MTPLKMLTVYIICIILSNCEVSMYKLFFKLKDLFLYIKFSIYMKIVRHKIFKNKNDVHNFFKYNRKLIKGVLIMGFISSIANLGATAMTNQANRDINLQNIKFQEQNLEYQKDLQQQIFEREDTAYQRKVQDLIKAGINPAVAATGSGSAAGSVVSTQAPHNDMRYQAPQFNFGSVIDTLKSLKQIASIEEQTNVAKSQAEYLSSLKKKADSETVKIGLENGFFSQTQADRLKRIGFETDMLMYQKDMLARQNELNKIGYNFALGNSVMNNFQTPNAPLLQELQINQDLLKLKKEFSQQNVKKIKLDNSFAPWLFGADMLQRLLNMGNSAMQMVGKGALYGLW